MRCWKLAARYFRNYCPSPARSRSLDDWYWQKRS